jgi:hypothetical protein
MAAGHDSHTVDEEGVHEHPGGGEPIGGHAEDEHGDHGHDDHGHDDHGSGGDGWVLIPVGIGLVVGLIIAIWLGFGSGASPLG